MNTFIRKIILIVFINAILCRLSYAQNVNSFSVNEEASLSSLLSDISSSEDILFAYPTQLVENINIKALKLDYSSIEDLIIQLLDETALELSSIDNQYFLIRERQSHVGESSVLEGQVVDADSGNGLPFATIYSQDFQRGTMTDSSGKYRIEYYDDSDSLYFSFLGYEDLVFSVKELKELKNIALSQSSQMLDDVMISFIIPPAMVSENGQGLMLSNNVLNSKASGLFGSDVLRNVQMVAGVSAHEDNSASLKIRGSNVEGSKIVFNGMTLFNVNHYYGIFSAINSDVVHKTALYKNTQPIEYIDTNGGLLTINSCDKMDESSNIVRLNLLTTSAYFNNNLSDKVKLEIAGRTSYRNVNDTQLFDGEEGRNLQFSNPNSNTTLIVNEPLFRFYDITTSLKISLGKHKTAFNFFKSYDFLDNSYDRNIGLDNINSSSTLYNNVDTWSNLGFSLVDEFQIDDSKSIHTNIQYVDYSYSSLIESRLMRQNVVERIENNNEIGLTQLSLNSFLKINQENATIKLGAELSQIDVEHRLEIEDNKPLLNYKDDIFYVTTFADYERRMGKFIFNAGIRTPISMQKDEVKILYSPVFSTAYDINSNSKLKASYNYSNQILRELEYESRLGQNYSFFRITKGKSFPILKTHKFMLGYVTRKGKLGFDAELYYKSTDGAMQLLSPTTGFDPEDNIPGTGVYNLYVGERRSYGLDLMLDYTTKTFTSWLAYSLSKSEDKYPDLFNGEYYLSQIDRRHQLKWINTYRFGKFELGANFIYASGRPYLPLEDVGDVMGKDKFDAKKFQRMLPSYIRFDMSLDYNFMIGQSDVQVGLSVFNLSNRQNLKYVQYSHKISGQNSGEIVVGTGGDLLDRTVNFNFNIAF